MTTNLISTFNILGNNVHPSQAIFKCILEGRDSDLEAYLEKDENLTIHDSTYGFTPLHVSVLCGNVKATSCLLSKKPGLIRVPDFAGWTPLHIVAATDNKQLRDILFAVSEADTIAQTVRTNLGATAKTMQTLLQGYSQETKTPTFHYKTSKEGLRNSTAKIFHQLTHATLIDRLLVTPQSLLSLRLVTPLKEEQSIKCLSESILRQSNDIKDKSIQYVYLAEVDSKVGWGIFALKKIPKGTIIWEYFGELITQEEFKKIPYSDFKVTYGVPLQTSVIDGRFKRNLAAMTNCGFPNAIPYFVYNEGLPHYYLVALEDIEENQQICFDYGFEHPCKERWYSEIRKTELEQFIQKKTLRAYLEELIIGKGMIEKAENLEQLLLYLALKKKLAYIFCTPTILVKYTLRKDLDIKIVKEMLNDVVAMKLLDFHHQEQFLNVLQQIIDNVESILIREKENQASFILHLLELYTFVSVNLWIEWFKNHPEETWEKNAEKIKETCRLYDEISLQIASLYQNDAAQSKDFICRALVQKFSEVPSIFKRFILTEIENSVNHIEGIKEQLHSLIPSEQK